MGFGGTLGTLLIFYKSKTALKIKSINNYSSWDFPGSPVVKTLLSNVGDVGSIPWQGAKIPYASWPKPPKR